MHGGSAIRHRFLLSAVSSNTPCDWAERDETRSNQLFLLPKDSEHRSSLKSFPITSWCALLTCWRGGHGRDSGSCSSEERMKKRGSSTVSSSRIRR
jgi:hypothetical protein